MGIHGLSRGVLALATVRARTRHHRPAPSSQPTPPAAAPAPPPEVGIPITNKTVQTTCGGCHRPDDKGQMSRISFQRNTPEGWQDTIKRMMALNGLKLDPAAGREVVKYLSDNLGLAPEEARPVGLRSRARVVVDETYVRTARPAGRVQRLPLAGPRASRSAAPGASGNC